MLGEAAHLQFVDHDLRARRQHCSEGTEVRRRARGCQGRFVLLLLPQCRQVELQRSDPYLQVDDAGEIAAQQGQRGEAHAQVAVAHPLHQTAPFDLDAAHAQAREHVAVDRTELRRALQRLPEQALDPFAREPIEQRPAQQPDRLTDDDGGEQHEQQCTADAPQRPAPRRRWRGLSLAVFWLVLVHRDLSKLVGSFTSSPSMSLALHAVCWVAAAETGHRRAVSSRRRAHDAQGSPPWQLDFEVTPPGRRQRCGFCAVAPRLGSCTACGRRRLSGHGALAADAVLPAGEGPSNDEGLVAALR